MAIDPGTEYGAQVDTSTDPTGYPYGQARNISVAGDGTGTPLEKKWLSDIWGFLQNLLSEGSVTPSGNPDKVGVSDYTDALDAIYFRNTAATTLSDRVTDLEDNDDFGQSYAPASVSGATNITVTYTDVNGRAIVLRNTGSTVVDVVFRFDYTSTASGSKQIVIPVFNNSVTEPDNNFAQNFNVIGHGTAFHNSNVFSPAIIFAETGTKSMRVAWTDTTSSGTGVFRGSFRFEK